MDMLTATRPLTRPVQSIGIELKLPLVSIVITNYNYDSFVCAAIESVRRQSYENFECVVVDDASKDDSYEVISEYLLKIDDSRFRFIRLGKNLGQMGAAKAGLELSTGAFVTFLDADDILLPNFIHQHLIAHLNSSYSAGISASDTIQISEDGSVIEGTFHTLVKHRSDYPQGPTRPILADALHEIGNGQLRLKQPQGPPVYHVDRSLLGWHGVAMSSFMFRRDMLELIFPDGEDEGMRICADYYLATFAHLIGGTLTIWSPLTAYRLHRKNGLNNNPVLGGPHTPGFFSQEMKNALDQAICRHIVANIDAFSRIFSMDLCINILRRFYPRYRLYEIARKSASLRSRLGKGRSWLFKLKYGFYYRLVRRK